MTPSLQQIAELKAEIADLTAKNVTLQRGLESSPAGGGNGYSQLDAAAVGQIIADTVEDRLHRSERVLREDFVGKFSGILSPLLERLADRVVTLESMTGQIEKELSRLDGRFKSHLDKIISMINDRTQAMSVEVGKHTDAAAQEMDRMYKDNQCTLEFQLGRADKAINAAEVLMAEMEALGDRLDILEATGAEESTKVAAAVKKFEEITEEKLKATSESARQKIEESAELADQLMTRSRARYRKTLMRLDAKLLEHPFKLTLAKSAILIIACTLCSTIASWKVYDYQGRVMLTAAALSMRDHLTPVMQAANRRTEADENAERWEALTKGLNYEQQKQFFAAMQRQAKTQGRNVETPKSLQR